MVDEANCFFQLSLNDEQIVNQAASMQSPNTAIEGRAIKKSSRLRLHYVAQSHELRLCCEGIYGVFKLLGRDRSPSYDAANGFAVLRDIEEPPSLFQRLSSLNCDGSIDAGARKFDGKIRWQKIAAERRHVFVDPAVFCGGVTPQMMMSVDDTRLCRSAHAGRFNICALRWSRRLSLL